jgi:hypothetical protein
LWRAGARTQPTHLAPPRRTPPGGGGCDGRRAGWRSAPSPCGRYAELVASLRLVKASSAEPALSSILRALRGEVERLLAETLARQHATRKSQAAFLINNYDLVATTLAERGARAEDAAHFEQLLDSIKAPPMMMELRP